MARLSFRVLGPPEVLVDGQPVPIASTRQRIVVATLVMAANRVVSVDRLTDAVWDGNPPLSARGQVQICVSALRRTVGEPNLIETWPSGYCIRADEDQLDYGTFDAEVNRGRAALAHGNLEQALRHYDAALGLWRGPALAGLPGRAAAVHANMLEERRLLTIEDRIEVRLRLGAHRELVEDLVALTAENPLRERLWGFRMIALYRSGRQAEALDAYRAARLALVDELGLEPSEDLRQIERAILKQDASLDFGTPDPTTRQSVSFRLPRQLPADIPDFTGRLDVVESVERMLTTGTDPGAVPGAMPVVLVTGPAGCGKSALAVHVAHRIRDRFGEGQLYADLRGSTGDPTPIQDVLAYFLRALGVDHDAVPTDWEERIFLFRSAIADRRILVVLDDVAADQRIGDVLPGTPGPAVLMTSRSRLAMLPGAQVVELDVMTAAESARMLLRIAGGERVAPDDAVSSLVQMCGGLPLALRICAMQLLTHPHWTVLTLVDRLTDERHRLDELGHGSLGVRPVLASAHDSLGERPRRLLGLLSLLDMPDFSALVAAAVLDTDLKATEQILDELASAQVIKATATAGGLVRYRIHELTRIFMRERVAEHSLYRTAEQTAAIERGLGCLLTLAGEAHRRVYGGNYSMLSGSSPRWPGAEPHLDRILADPARWFEDEYPSLRAAIEQAADLGLDELCWELAVITVVLCEYRGLFTEGPSILGTALQAVKVANNPRGRAAVLASMGLLGAQKFTSEDERMLLDSLAYFIDTGDALGQAFAVRGLAYLDQIQGRPSRAARRYERALERFRVVGDKAAQAHVVSGLARAYLDWGNVDRAESLAKESLLLSQQVDNRRLQAEALRGLGEVLFRSSQTLAARAVFQQSSQIITPALPDPADTHRRTREVSRGDG